MAENTLKNIAQQALNEAAACLERVLADEAVLAAIAAAGHDLAAVFTAGGRAYSCGNGGSMCDAMHFAEELAGRFRDDRRALPAMAISDPGYITCTANDFGYDEIFARFLQAHGRKGDILLAISTSGRSPNVIKAAKAARALGVRVIALTGKANSELSGLADIEICTPGNQYADRTQELHIKVIHILIEMVEQQMFKNK